MEKHRLRLIREALGLTQVEFGNILSTTQAKINSIETGRHKGIPPEWAVILKQRYNVSIEYTLCGIEPIFSIERDLKDLVFLKDKYNLSDTQLDFLYNKFLLNPCHIDVLMDFLKNI